MHCFHNWKTTALTIEWNRKVLTTLLYSQVSTSYSLVLLLSLSFFYCKQAHNSQDLKFFCCALLCIKCFILENKISIYITWKNLRVNFMLHSILFKHAKCILLECSEHMKLNHYNIFKKTVHIIIQHMILHLFRLTFVRFRWFIQLITFCKCYFGTWSFIMMLNYSPSDIKFCAISCK